MTETVPDINIRKSVNAIYETFKDIIKEPKSKENIFIINSKGYTRDLRGEELDKTSQLTDLYNQVKTTPLRANHLHISEQDGTDICQILYIPDAIVDPQGFRNNEPTLDKLLQITEETFHSMDKLDRKHIESREAVAVLARYYVLRALTEDSTNIGLSQNRTEGDIIDKSMGLTVYTRRNTENNLNIHSFCRTNGNKISRILPDEIYDTRLYFVSLLKEWQDLPLAEVKTEFKKLYKRILNTKNLKEVIKQIGVKTGSVPEQR
jgi:hypothetical protein